MAVRQLFRISVMLVITQMIYRAVTQQCPGGGSEASIVGQMLQRHIYKRMLADLPLTCLFVCREDDRCQSFNWVFSRLVCEFNNRTKEARPEDFVANPERSYFRRDKNRVPLGSIPELPAETCNEIKMSEGHAVSGKYWFSTIKTGTSALAHCNTGTIECEDALGMETGAIPDAHIRASSEWDGNHSAIQGRLNFKARGDKRGAWSAVSNDVNQWLQVDLGNQHTQVTGVATQGRNGYGQWVTKYKLQYSHNGVNFFYYKVHGQSGTKSFVGNTDQDTVVKHKLGNAIRARYIRIRPTAWHNHISIRVELYGCQAFIAKSCSDLKMLAPTAESGHYIIDSDDEGNLPAFKVYCNMTDWNGVGVTVISHDSESRTLVDGYEEAGSYSRVIHYKGASLSQLASLTKVSSYCEQFISYECFGSKMLIEGDAWWVSRVSTKMTYWGGALPGSGKCACGMNKSCGNLNNVCNCDKNEYVWRNDSGLLSDKSHLPVIQLRFGDTGIAGQFGQYDEKGYHTLGKLRCHGIA